MHTGEQIERPRPTDAQAQMKLVDRRDLGHFYKDLMFIFEDMYGSYFQRIVTRSARIPHRVLR